MATRSAGSYLILTVSLDRVHNEWALVVDGNDGQRTVKLRPAIFVIRLWRADAGSLRGTVRLHRTGLSAPLQTNRLLEELIRAWLSDSGAERASEGGHA